MFRAFFLGISLGLLFAPKAGKDMRTGICNLFTDLKENGTEKFSELEEKGSEYVDQFSKRLIQAGEMSSDLIGKTVGKVDDIRRTGGEAMERVSEKLSHVGELGEQATELKNKVLDAGKHSWERAKEAAESAALMRKDNAQMKSQGDAETAMKGQKQGLGDLKAKREIAEGQEARAEEMRKQEDFMDDGSRGTLERGTGEADVEKAEQAKIELNADNGGEQENFAPESEVNATGELDMSKAEELAKKLNSHHVSTPEHKDVA